MNALEKLKHIDKGMTNIIQWDAVSGDLLRQMCAWQKQLKLAIHQLESELKEASLKHEGNMWGLGLEMGKLKTEHDKWKDIACQLAESGDPKPWKIDDWKQAKQKCDSEKVGAWGFKDGEEYPK